MVSRLDTPGLSGMALISEPESVTAEAIFLQIRSGDRG